MKADNKQSAEMIGPEFVEVRVSKDGKTVWVNVDNVCRFRATQVGRVYVDPDGPKTEKDTFVTNPEDSAFRSIKKSPR